jgi:hypothetical protein
MRGFFPSPSESSRTNMEKVRNRVNSSFAPMAVLLHLSLGGGRNSENSVSDARLIVSQESGMFFAFAFAFAFAFPGDRAGAE